MINTKKPDGDSVVPYAALQGLAIVGFITLVIAGIWLAVYAARFVPASVDGLSTAAVSLSHIFTPTQQPNTLAIVPNATSTDFSAVQKTISTTNTNTKVNTGSAKPTHRVATNSTKIQHKTRTARHITTRAGKRTTHTYNISNNTPIIPKLYGLPDLVTHITAVGYLTSTSTKSFIATSTIPAGTRVAVKFTITNVGTNKTGAWTFTAHIPTHVSYIFNSPTQQSLSPHDHIDYVLGFTQAAAGSNQIISIMANPKHTIAESNFKNNSADMNITILGR